VAFGDVEKGFAQSDAFNYFYFRKGLDAWQKEYKKVRG